MVTLNSIEALPVPPDEVIELNCPNAHCLFTDNSNQKLGYDNGVFKDEIPYTCPIIDSINGENNSSNLKESYFVPDPSIKMELYGTGTGNAELYMITQDGLITADVPVSPTSVDQFKVLNNGTGIAFIPENGDVPSLGLMLDVETTDHAQIVNTSISHIEAGGYVNLSNNNGIVSIQNNGQARTCNVSLEQATSDQNSSVTVSNIAIEAGSTVYFKPSDWNNLSGSTVTIEHDVGSDGTIDYIQTIGQQNAPILPVANFTANITEGYAPLDVQFTNLSTNATHLEWNFGDNTGNVSSSTPEHVFTSAGLFNVVLTANNANGTSSYNMTINATTQPTIPPTPIYPVAIIGMNVTSGKTPLTVQFNDLSVYETKGRIWNFGDGSTSTEQNPIHTFNNVQDYTVTLTANNDNGSNVTTQTVSVTTTPVVPTQTLKINDFSADKLSGQEHLTVNFSSNVTGNPVKWIWTFKGTLTERKVTTTGDITYTFPIRGTYDVDLIIVDAKGSQASMHKKAYVKVLKTTPPKANFAIKQLSNNKARFMDKSLNTPTYWHWTFGDGTTSDEQNPMHTYDKPGKYTVMLAVHNDGGGSAKQIKNCVTVKKGKY